MKVPKFITQATFNELPQTEVFQPVLHGNILSSFVTHQLGCFLPLFFTAAPLPLKGSIQGLVFSFGQTQQLLLDQCLFLLIPVGAQRESDQQISSNRVIAYCGLLLPRAKTQIHTLFNKVCSQPHNNQQKFKSPTNFKHDLQLWWGAALAIAADLAPYKLIPQS